MQNLEISGNSETQVFKFSRVQLKVKTVKSSLCEVSLTPGEFDVSWDSAWETKGVFDIFGMLIILKGHWETIFCQYFKL